MTRWIIRLSFLLLALFDSTLAWAQAPSNSWSSLVSQLGGLNPPVTDRSIGYLGQLFGTVGGVLHGTSGQLLSQIFGTLNYGMVLVAGGYVGYTVFWTVIKTTQDGAFMGREGKSAWITIRTVTGLGLLAPVFNGYSTLQAMVLWVVIHGVGFADFAWATALNYLKNQGGVVFLKPQNPGEKIDEVMKILSNQVCMYSTQKDAKKVRSQALKNLESSPDNPIYLAAAKTRTTGYFPKICGGFKPDGSDGNKLCFPGYDGVRYVGYYCGIIDFETSKDKEKMKYEKAAANQIVLDLTGVAQRIADGKVPRANELKNKDTSATLTAIIGASADFLNITLPLRSRAASGGSRFFDQGSSKTPGAVGDYYDQAIAQGWISAGSYYYDLGNINRSLNSASDVSLDIRLNKHIAKSSGMQKLLDSYKSLAKSAASAISSFDSSETSGFQTQVGVSGSSRWLQYLTPVALIQSIFAVLSSWGHGNPVLMAQNLGDLLMSGAILFWTGTVVALFIAVLAVASGASVNPLPYATQAVIAFLAPALTVLTGIIFSAGATLAIYVPLIPYILFTFGAIGWLVFVMEAMVAAPLVALGITHPEGQDFLGKSEQALMLLLSVFLRPILLIVGLLSGMVLSYVAVRMLNSGFFYIVKNVLTLKAGLAWAFVFIALIVVYTMIMVSLINQCYGLIYMIPERVMRWIGLGPDQSGMGREALQMVEGGLGKSSQGLGSSFSQSAQGVGKVGYRARKYSNVKIGDANAKGNKKKGGGGEGGDGEQEEGED